MLLRYAEESGSYGASGEYAFVPCALGIFLGATFVFLADYCIPTNAGDAAEALRDMKSYSSDLNATLPVNEVKMQSKSDSKQRKFLSNEVTTFYLKQ